MNKPLSIASRILFLSPHIMKHLRQSSRRQFLRQSSIAMGAALAAPTLVPASALGRNGIKAPSERINMGFIGLGGQGTGHLLGGAWTYVPGGYSARSDVDRKSTRL